MFGFFVLDNDIQFSCFYSRELIKRAVMPKSKKNDSDIDDELVDPLPGKLRHAVVRDQ